MIFLSPIKESTEDYEQIEREIINLFKREIYIPLLAELGEKSKSLKNASSGLIDAIGSGRITFNRGVFSGKLNSTISKELRALGARFDRRTGTYRINISELPSEIRHSISASSNRFFLRLQSIDRKLSEIAPKELADKLNVTDHFDRAIFKVEKKFQRTIRGIAIAPELTDHARKRIAGEWGQNMQLWIQEFAEKEIVELRQNLMASALRGNRYGSAIQTIQRSYGVTQNKAKFLARQETGLLMTKLRQVRYQDAGVNYYMWKCVTGTASHPVRPMHKIHDGKIFRWDQPPVVDVKGDRKNPGQDYNCRCFPRPMVGYDPSIPDGLHK